MIQKNRLKLFSELLPLERNRAYTYKGKGFLLSVLVKGRVKKKGFLSLRGGVSRGHLSLFI